MNKRGQLSIFFLLMMGVVFFLLGLALAPAINDTVNEGLDDPLLNCSTTTDDQTKAVCTSMDIDKLYIGIIFGLAGVLLVGVAVRWEKWIREEIYSWEL